MNYYGNDLRKDFIEGEERYVFTARGVFKCVIFEFIEHPLDGKKTIKVAKQIFDIISNNGYGKSQYEIFTEVKLMDIERANIWTEEIYDKYIFQDDILNIFGK